MLPVLQVGPLSLQTPGLVLLVSLWLGISLAEKHAHRHGISPKHLWDLVFTALVAGALGARLVYVLRYPQAFVASPMSLLSVNPGLFDPLGGIAAGFLASLAYAQQKKLPGWPALDTLTPLLAVFMVGLNLSNFASGAAFGAPTHLPWGIVLWGTTRHPTQVYEGLTAFFILALLWPGSAPGRWHFPGQYFLTFLALSAAARLFLEAFRGDSHVLANGLRIEQILAWILLAICLWALQRLKSRLVPTSTPSSEPQ